MTSPATLLDAFRAAVAPDHEPRPPALPVSAAALARIYRIAPPSLKALQTRQAFSFDTMSQPGLLFAQLMESGRRGKLRTMLSSPDERWRCMVEIHSLKYPTEPPFGS